ncbi:MAG: sigE 11 [Aeromicrobium sp.]|nr:sigE 11 [Aeromicrobium sp.]
MALNGVQVHTNADTEFAEFFTATWASLFRTTYAVSGDVGSAEDALQSAYAKAYASWRKVRTADSPEAYVRRMAINEVLGVRRHAWWKAERSVADPPPTAAVISHESALEDRDEMWRAILALPLRQRAVIVLRYYEDLSEEQIAESLGCSRGTVKSQASAALATLRARGMDLSSAPGQSGDQQ